MREDRMRSPRLMAAIAALALGMSGCGPRIDVRTVANPETGIGSRRTFRVLPVPERRSGPSSSPNDPMLVNSVSNHALRNDLVEAFEDRGYVETDTAPDFEVAYYASAKEKLDVTAWDYGYAWRPRWWRGWGPADVTEYTEGSVIIDVIDPTTKQLLWRGRGVAAVSDNERTYESDLKKTVTAVLDKFPAAHPDLSIRPELRERSPLGQ
ncbi:MAG: hypothetical protein DMD33_06985 [Gemmatimonadetes bacterium]|nr:MAG: hypothetical protein DMD33_06985 [Gemmatimonadota bacterium]PYO73744.1 MAG: hypothetical protein DMD67_15100 [Gemmatimonadota bacterium]TLY49194.1 MAG: DUF4136 domain-containing protein [Gemmatimonadota bacterium]